MEPLRGYHVTCDGRAEKPDWTLGTISAWLEDVIALSSMTVIAGPETYEHKGTLIGKVIIAESHIAVHVNPATGEVYAEMFSCKQFHVPTFVEVTVRHFGIVGSGAVRWFRRGAG